MTFFYKLYTILTVKIGAVSLSVKVFVRFRSTSGHPICLSHPGATKKDLSFLTNLSLIYTGHYFESYKRPLLANFVKILVQSLKEASRYEK